MEIKRSIEISVEKTRRFVIRQPKNDETILCPACNEPMLTAEAAAASFQLKCRLVYRLVEANATHFVETETGAMLVCLQSLNQAIGDADAPTAQIGELLTNPATEIQTEKFEIKRKSI